MDIEKSRKSLCVPGSVSISSRLFLIAALGVVFTTTVSCAGVTKGPVLLRVSEDRAALMWETETEGPSRLYYWRNREPERYVESTPEKVQYETKKDGKGTVTKTAFIHKVWLEDLEAGQVYKYRVIGPEAQSKVYKFHTTPADTDEARFIIYGDSRTNPGTHRKLVELMMNKKVDFVVNSGDLVSRGKRYEQWGPQFFEPLKGLAETVPVYIAKGNHEGNSGNFEKLLIPEGGTNSFGFDYGPVHYFCVDNVSGDLKSEELLKLIASDAKNSTARWKFVSYHKPSLNFGGHWSAWGYPDALPMLAKSGVDFVITGHSHQYERFRPVAPPGNSDGGYVTYITSGGGGAPLSRIEQSIYHAEAGKIYHFCLFHIRGDELTMDTFDINGKIIDHLKVVKTDGRLNKQYLWTAVPVAAVHLHQDLHKTQPTRLSTRPKKNQPFNVTYKLSVPTLGEQAKMTFKLRCDEGTYQLPEPKTLTIPKEGGAFNVEFTVVPLTEVKVSKKPIVPALWLECHYEIGRVREHISHPIIAKP